jgi:Flp pilus assembly protein TadG
MRVLLRHSTCLPRRGVTILESAIVYPLVFLLILGLIIGGMGVYRYQQAAALARSAARYASTHGAQYRKDVGLSTGTAGTAATSQNGILWYKADPTSASGSDTSWTGDIYDNGVRPNMVAMDRQMLSCQVGWPPVKNPSGDVVLNTPDNWPGSTVTVTVSYTWVPQLFFVGPFTLSSTATMPVTN